MKMMRITNGMAWALVVVGVLNWGLVALAGFDLLATIAGNSFGEINLLTRMLYALIGLSGLWLVVRFLQTRAGRSLESHQAS